ncbi:MAG TPA: hypothetical protein VGL34_30855 [Steroidobacteraceae bacterium]
MNRTRFLVVLLLVVVLIQLFPGKAGTIELVAVGAGILYYLTWATLKFLAEYKKKSAQAAQAAADEQEYREYKTELDSIRAKYNANRDWDELTSIPQECKDELSTLHDRHQAMLTRKFGPS